VPVVTASTTTPAPGTTTTAPLTTAPGPVTTAPAAVALAAASPVAEVPVAAPVGNAPLFIQAGAFSDPANAQRLADRLRSGSYGKVFVRDDQIAGRRMYRVRIGPVPDVAQFDRVVAALEKAGVTDAHLALD
jgi:rare lipoprotein A